MTQSSLQEPEVSIVTVFHNRVNLVGESVASLLDQDFPNYEVIVVDDGSTDGTAEFLQNLEDPRLRVISQRNSGFTASVRNAIGLASGRFIAVHGAGDISHPNRLAVQSAILREFGSAGIVGCAYNYKGVRVSPSSGSAVETGNVLARLAKNNPFSHGEVMFRKSVYQQVGGYDPRFTYAQDFDLWLRMGEHCDYAIAPETLYTKMDPANSVRRNVQKYYLQQKFAQFALERAQNAASGSDDITSRLERGEFSVAGSKKYATRFFSKGVEAIGLSDFDAARFIFRKAWNEWHDAAGLAALAMSYMSGNKVGQRLLRFGLIAKWRVAGRRGGGNTKASGSAR